MSEQTSTPKLTGQFSKALVYAEPKHHNQVRKGGDIPYVGHLLSVAGLVINDGGSEDAGHRGAAARLPSRMRADPRRWTRSRRTSARTSRASSTSAATPTRSRSRRGANARPPTSITLATLARTPCWFRWPTSSTTRGRCCATTTSTARRCGSGSP